MRHKPDCTHVLNESDKHSRPISRNEYVDEYRCVCGESTTIKRYGELTGQAARIFLEQQAIAAINSGHFHHFIYNELTGPLHRRIIELQSLLCAIEHKTTKR